MFVGEPARGPEGPPGRHEVLVRLRVDDNDHDRLAPRRHDAPEGVAARQVFGLRDAGTADEAVVVDTDEAIAGHRHDAAAGVRTTETGVPGRGLRVGDCAGRGASRARQGRRDHGDHDEDHAAETSGREHELSFPPRRARVIFKLLVEIHLCGATSIIYYHKRYKKAIAINFLGLLWDYLYDR